ncbi:PAS domain S-box protein [Methanoplanus endosymbiosus]|uniref:PAS domain S-box protein n=1 Tax=Methanoplanus endosymbiosus TaxID=33865 RepID=A0A9E7TK81_9EURY|nr:PAS domain S-box protein [Methanoplanus endosymbiosus]UUX92504.1 PAS domain S-box protein [Methanoplanus endosymbiosus]
MNMEDISGEKELISVLYVDDEPILLKGGKIFLEKNGELAVTTCDNADDAIKLISEKPFDAIISDIQMPGLDGISFLRHIRKRGDNTPFIIFTGKGHEELVIDALNGGADYYLEKGKNPGVQFIKISEEVIHLVDRKRSEALAKSFFYTHTDLMFVKDENFRYITANDANLKFFGISHEKLLHKTDSDLMEPDAAAYCLESDKKAILTGKKVVSEETAGGRVYETTKFPIKIAHNRRGVAGIVRDITDRKEASERISDIEYLNRHIIEAIPDILIRCKGDGTLADIRTPDEGRLIARREESLGKRITEVIPGELGTMLMEKIRSALENKRIEKAEYPVDTPDGLSYYEARIIPYLEDEIIAIIRDITDRREAEEELKRKNEELSAAEEELRQQVDEIINARSELSETNEYLNSLINYASSPIIVWNPEFKITRFNKAAEELTGILAGEAVGRNLQILFPKEERESYMEIVRQAMDGERLKAKEISVLHRSGDVKNVIWNSANILNRDGSKLISVIAQGQDITKRKLGEMALKESEEKFKQLFENMSSGVAVLRPDDNGEDFVFVDINKAAEEIDRIKREDVIGKKVTEIFPGVKDLGLFDIFKEVAKTGRPAFHPTGEYRDDRIYGWRENRVYRLPSGLIVAVYNDITPLKQAEEELKGSEEKFRSYIENAPVGVFITDKEGRYIDVNPAAAEMTGYSMEEMLNMTVRDLASPNAPPKTVLSFIKLRDEGSVESELLLRRKDGTDFYSMLKAVALDKDRLMGFCSDITELKETEDELKRKNEDLFAAEEELRQQLDELVQAQERLEEREAYIRAVVDNIPVGIAVNSVTPEVKFEYHNENFLKYYRITAKDLDEPDRFWENVYKDPDFREEIKNRVLTDIKSGDQNRMHWEEIPITRPGEETTYINARDIPLEKGGSVISMVMDVTEEKKSKDQINLHLLRVKSLLGLHRIANRTDDEILNYALENSLSMTNSRYAFIGIMSPDESGMTIQKWSEDVIKEYPVHEKTVHLEVGEGGALTECIRKRAPVIFNDYSAPHPEKHGCPKGHVEIIRFLAVPIFDGDRITAVISVANKETDYRDDDTNAIISLGNMMWEIFRNKRSQEKIEESESRLRAIVDNLPRGAIHIMDRDLCYVFSAGPELENTGLNSDYLTGKSVYDVLDPENAENISSALKSVFDSGENITTEAKFSGQDFLVQMAPLRDPDGRITHVIELSVNITTEKEAEERLQEQKELFKRTFESLQDAGLVLGTDSAGIIAVNSAAISLFGYSRREIIGQTADFLHEDKASRELFYGHIHPYFKEHRNIPRFEFRMKRKDGSVFPAEHSITPLYDSGGEISGWVFIIRDITEIKEMESREKKAIEQIEENMEQLATLNDQIRNPLAVISGYVEIKCPDISKEIDEQIDMIDRIVARLDAGWIRSEKIWEYLKTHYGVGDEYVEEMR